MVTNQMSVLFKQAVTTFTCKKELLYSNLEILKAVLDKTTASDVDLHPQFMNHSLWTRPNKAPVTYVDIYENETLSMGIFILKPGMKLPLHDHPQMYGLLKVIAGTIKITSFSLHTEKTLKCIGKSCKHPSSEYPMTVIAERNPDILADSLSETCILEPDKGNLHEIESIGGPAAFIDILAPPYETEIPDYGARKCTYFSVVKELAPQVCKLEEINSPSWFWNDVHPYTGLEIFND